jgi:hypothetical protein
MCCDTGVCGPEIDPALPRFAADLEWLRSQGVEVQRFNLAQEPGAFVGDPLVKAEIHNSGEACLPLLVLGNEVLSRGDYPNREQLASWVGLELVSTADESVAVSAGCCGGSESSCC